jgi:Arc/MetJ-type ribon-helix-helix transcriptional regulator
MNISLGPDLEKRIAERIHKGEYTSLEALVTEAVSRFIDQIDEEDAELHETRDAINQAFEELDRGEGRPADEVFAELRTEYGIPR